MPAPLLSKLTESTMKKLVSISMTLFILSCSQVKTVEPNTIDLSKSIVKIQALSGNGKQNLGSGVVVAPNLIATNCHVTRAANRAYLIDADTDRVYSVLAQASIPDYDVCILKTEALSLPVAELAESETIKIGDEIMLSGYPYALNLRTMQGKVIGLHPYGQDQIIEINTGFNHGASGGGVFNRSGHLIGLMTFMGSEAGVMHFYVIPASWLAMGLEKDFAPLQSFSAHSFWEKGNFKKQLTELRQHKY
jgi:S1-C subfamily serine protease